MKLYFFYSCLQKIRLVLTIFMLRLWKIFCKNDWMNFKWVSCVYNNNVLDLANFFLPCSIVKSQYLFVFFILKVFKNRNFLKSFIIYIALKAQSPLIIFFFSKTNSLSLLPLLYSNHIACLVKTMFAYMSERQVARDYTDFQNNVIVFKNGN